MDITTRVRRVIVELPVAHRVMIAASLVGLVLLGVVFVDWVTSPAYTLLYSDLDDASLQQVIDGLEDQGVPYSIDGGSRVLVPRDQLYAVRAALAADGVQGGEIAPPGYELLDEQGVGVSDFKQRVDFQRALEGELGATLAAMRDINAATVRLVMPEEELFAEDQQPVTASVLLDPVRELDPAEVETVAFMVASSVEGLDADNVTVADTAGTVLQAPGDAGGTAVTSRLLRQTRELEQSLAGDVRQLIATAGGGQASVVVRAVMDYDESETTRESYDPTSRVALRQDSESEVFEGDGVVPGGTVGVDGGPAPDAGTTDSQYERDADTVEYGVDKEVTTTRTSPGTVEQLSVAVVMDDGALTGTTPPAIGEVERLVTAGLGLDEERGDTVAVSAVSFPEAQDAEEPAATTDMVGMAGQVVAIVVLLVIAFVLLRMLRRRRPSVDVIDVERTGQAPAGAIEAERAGLPAPDVAAIKAEVTQLVDEQPEDVAVLLRSWLADRRA